MKPTGGPTDAGLADALRRSAEAEERLAEVEETLWAIHHGEVDALVVSEGSDIRVFTLSSADRPYRMFVESMSDGAATVSAAGVVLYANPRLAEMLMRPVRQIVGANIASFVDDADRLTPGPTETVEVDLRLAGGELVTVLLGRSRLEIDGADLTCLTFTDLTARRAQDREIRRLNLVQSVQLEALNEAQEALVLRATHDSLTGLPNRALLIDRVEQALSRGGRSGHWTAVLFVDLDHFKLVNDNRGHAAGDDVLRQVAEQLRLATRAMDTVARIGGDEFVVLTPDLVDQMEAVRIAGRLSAALQSAGLSYGVDAGNESRVTASIGISVTAPNAEASFSVTAAADSGAERMLHEADTAMYHAKSLGRNRIEVYDAGLSRRATQRAGAERSLQQALADGRVVAYYQPIIDLATGYVAGFEALARIDIRDSEVVGPDAFIDIAEESGLVVPLGAQILTAACREAQLWTGVSSARPDPTVAVNLSPRQLERNDLAAQIRVVLTETGLDAERLHLEITETALMELHPEVVRQLDRVRDLGVEIGLDDFGTGYASLTHLRQLPVTFIKVDRSFISGLGGDIQDEGIVAAVIDLAANLGLRSVAEGVESPQQLDRLQELGCQHAQGYIFARPAAVAEPRRTYPTSGAGYPI